MEAKQRKPTSTTEWKTIHRKAIDSLSNAQPAVRKATSLDAVNLSPPLVVLPKNYDHHFAGAEYEAATRPCGQLSKYQYNTQSKTTATALHRSRIRERERITGARDTTENNKNTEPK
ncbi:hypothetical protein QE152_g31216 [Popillia japonica]|uniref:Uncharacterized protein n=1 Tax=Popillia japonica TaxID=7064 RepID=A0AAW1JC91_POPJA